MTNGYEVMFDPVVHGAGQQPKALERKLLPRICTKECQALMDIAVTFQELDEDSRNNLLTFLSIGEFNHNVVNGDNVRQYLEIATALRNKKLFAVCEDVLLKNLCPQNSFSTFNYGTTYGLERLRSEAVKMIEVNIEDICESDDVQSMGANDLFDLLRNSNLKNSPFAIKAVSHWFVYEKDPRQTHYNNMVEYLQNVQARIRPLGNQKISHQMYQVMFSMEKSSLMVHVYEPSKNLQKKFKIKECKNVGSNFAVCCVQDSERDDPHIYISGGDRSPNTFYHCDIIMNKRKKCSKRLNYGRTKHGMAAIGKSVFVLGGTYKGEAVTAIEEFNSKRHSWKVVGHLCYPVHSAACVVFDNEIYTIGGVMANGEATSVIQKFCPNTGQSVIMGHLPFCASNTKAVVFNGSVFIASEDGKLVCYEPYFAVTKMCSPLPNGNGKFAMFSERDGIYVAGGLNDKQRKLCDIYRYVPDKHSWQRSETDLLSPMTFQCLCAVKVPPDFNLVPFMDCC